MLMLRQLLMLIYGNLQLPGLILFKDTHDDGYALVCGPGGSYNPPRGDLAGFCKDVCYDVVFITVSCFQNKSMQ